MPLSLSRREGEDFYLDDLRVVVEQVLDNGGFTLRMPDGDLVEVTEDRGIEVTPDVVISAGLEDKHRMVKVVIDAPVAVTILRGELR